MAVTQILTARPTHELGVWECRVAADPRGIPATERLRATWPQTRKQGSRSFRSGSWTTRTRGQVSKPRPRRERLAAVKRTGWPVIVTRPQPCAGALCTKGLLHSTWKEVVPDQSTTPLSESAGLFRTNNLISGSNRSASTRKTTVPPVQITAPAGQLRRLVFCTWWV